MAEQHTDTRFFTLPELFLFGWDCIDTLGDYTRERPVIITDRPVMEKAGHLQRVLSILDRKKLPPLETFSIEKEPGFEEVGNAAALCRQKKPDTIIALGGGAVMDTAKAAWNIYTDEASGLDSFFQSGPNSALLRREREKKCSLIAVPTTSGTGSEVTCAVVFTNPGTGLKKLLISPLFIPSVALLEPSFTLTMPPSVTAASGFDALTHGIESYLSKTATPFSKAAAIQAIRLINTSLPVAFKDGDNRSARENMLYASSLAGMAISNSCTGIAHSLDQVGPLLGIPHGNTLAPLFVPVLRCIEAGAKDELDQLGQAIGNRTGKSESRFVIEMVEELISILHLPEGFSTLGISKSAYQAAVEKTIPMSIDAFATLTSPVEADEKALRAVLEDAF